MSVAIGLYHNYIVSGRIKQHLNTFLIFLAIQAKLQIHYHSHIRIMHGASDCKVSALCIWLDQVSKTLMIQRTRPKNDGKTAFKKRHFFQPPHTEFPEGRVKKKHFYMTSSFVRCPTEAPLCHQLPRQVSHRVSSVPPAPTLGVLQNFLLMGSRTFGVPQKQR